MLLKCIEERSELEIILPVFIGIKIYPESFFPILLIDSVTSVRIDLSNQLSKQTKKRYRY